MRFLLSNMAKHVFIFLLASLIIFSSCKKKETESILGLDVQPETDALGLTITDTSTIYMHTISDDSVVAHNDRYKYLGANQDPIFGRTDASIYTNLSLPNNITGLTFGSNIHVSHAEIRLRFVGQVLGDTTTALEYRVYPLDTQLDKDSTYYTFRHLPRSSSPLCKITTKLKQIDTVSNHFGLVLPIDTVYAEFMLQNSQFLVNNSTFLSTYKGFYITVSAPGLSPAQQGAIVRVDLDDDASGLFVYYRNTATPDVKPKTYQFTFKGSDARRFNHFDGSHSEAIMPLYSQLTGDTAKGAYDVFLQGFGHTKIKLYLPFLKNFSDSQHVTINRAELILRVDQTLNGSNSNYPLPDNIGLLACNENQREAYVKDQYYYTLVKFGGDLNNTDKHYVFNIARQMQDIVDGKAENHGFFLVQADPTPQYVTNRDTRYERLVLGGVKNPVYKPVFKVTYTKFPYDK